MATTTTTSTKSNFFQKFISGLFSFFNKVKPIVTKIEAVAPLAEEVLGMAFPEVDGAITIANNVFGHVLAAAHDAQGAISANGLNVTIDGQLLQDILAFLPKAVAASVQTNAGSAATVLGVASQVAGTAAAPAPLGAVAVPN